MKLTFYSKHNTTVSFTKIKFYNLIIKTLLSQNLILTTLFQSLLLKYMSNLTQINNKSFSKFSQSINFYQSSHTWFTKSLKTPSTKLLNVTTKNHLLPKAENLENLRLYQIFSSLAFSKPFLYSKIHSVYRLLFNTINPNELVYVDAGKAFSQWSSTQSLLVNLFYYNIRVVSFTGKLLIDEVLSLNWKLTTPHLFSHSNFDKSIFFSPADTGPIYSWNYLRLSKFKIENAFIFDLGFHKRTVFFLRRRKFFTFSIVAATQSPWLVDHPIPVLSSTLLTQYYFLKLVTYAFSRGQNLYFTNCKLLWLKLYL